TLAPDPSSRTGYVLHPAGSAYTDCSDYPTGGDTMLGSIVGSVRRNHALEHATISVLLAKIGRDIRMVGRATRDGYYLYADIPQELLDESTHEALARLKSGEGYLA